MWTAVAAVAEPTPHEQAKRAQDTAGYFDDKLHELEQRALKAEAERDDARAQVEHLRGSADIIVGKSAAAVEDVARKAKQLADECARLAQDRAFVETVIAMWDAGDVAPHDVLVAIRDQLAGRIPGEGSDGGEQRG
jgi:hypothetical protein